MIANKMNMDPFFLVNLFFILIVDWLVSIHGWRDLQT